MKYRQLTNGQRHQIALAQKLGLTQTQIATELGVHKSTISRELKRNTQNGIYNPEHAQQQTDHRRKTAKKRTIDPIVDKFIHFFLKESELYFSPEQISYTLKKIGIQVSKEWIRRYINQDRANGGTLYKGLRNKGKKYNYKANPKNRIPNRVGIEHRPQIINTRQRIGDWEADLVLGKQGTGAIITLLERKSRYYLLRKIPNKKAETVEKAIYKMLKNHIVHSITFDNGTEFTNHYKIAQKLNITTYFCHPYRAWEKGQNEHHNRLLRQYIPKSTNLTQITQKRLNQISTLLNLRPRKKLNKESPKTHYQNSTEQLLSI